MAKPGRGRPARPSVSDSGSSSRSRSQSISGSSRSSSRSRSRSRSYSSSSSPSRSGSSRSRSLPPNKSDLWRDVLRANARKEFEEARFEKDPEIITRLLIGGQDAVQAALDKLVEKQRQQIAKEQKDRDHR